MAAHPYTEDAVRSFISDCVQTLRSPLCPRVFQNTMEELRMWFELLRGLEEKADWVPAIKGVMNEQIV